MAVAGPIIGAAQSDSGTKECMSLQDLALRLCHRLRLWRESRRRWRRDAIAVDCHLKVPLGVHVHPNQVRTTKPEQLPDVVSSVLRMAELITGRQEQADIV